MGGVSVMRALRVIGLGVNLGRKGWVGPGGEGERTSENRMVRSFYRCLLLVPRCREIGFFTPWSFTPFPPTLRRTVVTPTANT